MVLLEHRIFEHCSCGIIGNIQWFGFGLGVEYKGALVLFGLQDRY
jgi:hypothetical protein